MTKTNQTSSNQTVAFWDQVWTRSEPFDIDPEQLLESASQSDRKFFMQLGDITDKDVLDMGCGNGLLSVYLALRGARVTAIDTSPSAVDVTQDLAEYNSVGSSVQAHVLDAMDLVDHDSSYDLVTGRFILHHIEPFDEFAAFLPRIIRPGGKGVFFENNARNPILMFFRTFFVGKFGIPKYGDADEHPFEPKEIEMLRKTFADVQIYCPQFLCFELISPYLFRHNKKLKRILKGIDSRIYQHLRPAHRYSYIQIVELRK